MKKILIIDKDSELVDMLRKSLSDIDIKADSSSPITLALNLINLAPDIVFINLMLYLKNKQLFYHNKRRISNARIIVTAQTIHDPIYIKDIGADSFILKPFKPHVLRNTINKYCY